MKIRWSNIYEVITITSLSTELCSNTLILDQNYTFTQGVFLATGVWAFPTGNLRGRQEILDYFGQLVEIKQLVLFLETRILMANPIGQ